MPGGVFSTDVKRATPKYAINQGPREESYVGTMARMFVRVDASEWDVFQNSVGDRQVRNNLLPRIAGDPTQPRRQGHTVVDTGYVDFLLTSVNQGLREKSQVSETLADNFVVFYFGQSAPTWQFQGYFINTVQDDQHSNFLRLYLSVLRGTQLARRQKILSIKYDSFIVAGSVDSFNSVLTSANEILVPFTMNVIVKRLSFVRTTPNWTPTNPGGPFADDPFSVPYDAGPHERVMPNLVAVRSPADVVTAPNPNANAPDPRVNLAPPTSAPASTPSSPTADVPNFTPSSSAPTSVPLSADVVTGGMPETANANFSSNPNTRDTRPASAGEFTVPNV